MCVFETSAPYDDVRRPHASQKLECVNRPLRSYGFSVLRSYDLTELTRQLALIDVTMTNLWNQTCRTTDGANRR